PVPLHHLSPTLTPIRAPVPHEQMFYFSFYMMAGIGMAMNLREGIQGDSRKSFAASCGTAYFFESVIHLRVVLTPPNKKSRRYAIYQLCATDIP
mgnify:CR=1